MCFGETLPKKFQRPKGSKVAVFWFFTIRISGRGIGVDLVCSAFAWRTTRYRPDKNLAHYRTLQALPLILGQGKKADAAYLDACRIKRNTVEYDMAGAATQGDADELISFAEALSKEVLVFKTPNRARTGRTVK